MGKSPFLIAVDGAKGTGKSTLINLICSRLPASVRVVCWSEKELDPFREETEALLRRFRGAMTESADRTIAENLARSRAWIGDHVVQQATVDVVILDRWYPSDAVFRRHISFADCLAINHHYGVLEPDLVLAVTCDVRLAWDRAHSRERGLDSNVITSFQEHEASIKRFLGVAHNYGWMVVQNDGEPEPIARRMASLIQGRLDWAQGVSANQQL